MKSVVKNIQKYSDPKYPYIGKCRESNTIILFISKNTGTCIGNTLTSDLGFYSDLWDEDLCDPLKGSVTLSND